jgi:hypothetical protein
MRVPESRKPTRLGSDLCDTIAIGWLPECGCYLTWVSRSLRARRRLEPQGITRSDVRQLFGAPCHTVRRSKR